MLRIIGQVVLFLLVAGLVIMLLRAFDGDIFAIIEWVLSMIWYAISQVVSWLESTSLPEWLSIR